MPAWCLLIRTWPSPGRITTFALAFLRGSAVHSLHTLILSDTIPSAAPPPHTHTQGAPCLYMAPAVSDQHEVTVTFQLPCLRSNYPNKPEHYISHLLGHEGPGSLLSALKV